MRALYSGGIKLYGMAIKLAAPFNEKAKNWVEGRKNWRDDLKQYRFKDAPKLWFHAASLGELEQGIPVIKLLKEKNPKFQIIISFFSPSGYLNFKDQELAEAVVYLPLDTRANARDFLEILKPDLAVFLKYEVWPNFLAELKKRGIPTVLAPAVFRPKQIYFKPYGHFFQKALKDFSAILVQDESSQSLLQSLGISGSICGDSRFDQALKVKNSAYQAEGLDTWIDGKLCLVAGSSWPKEESLLEELLVKKSELKLILAPHQVDEKNIQRLLNQFQRFGVNRFSEKQWSAGNQVLIIDNIGHLKKLYRYGQLAFIGGGFGVSVHSTVEPSVYGIPLGFGPNYHKFIEAREMVAQELAFEIQNFTDLNAFVDRFKATSDQASFKPRMESYLNQKVGAAEKITASILKLLHD